jgi:localization factor PodJL
MHNLAVLSAGRPGVAPDYPTAVHWFSEAANRGLADSQYNLGILYESGLGVPSSSVEAYKWYALAARTGDKEAAKRRDAVSNKLDRNSLQAADALVIQWRAKPGEPIAR